MKIYGIKPLKMAGIILKTKEMIYFIFKNIGRLYYTNDRVEDQLNPHLPCILQDEEGNEYLTVLHGEDAEMPWHVGDEVLCDMTFRVKERYGRAYQEISVRNITLLNEFIDEIFITKGGKKCTRKEK